MPTYQHQMQRVSSSRIRHALSAGDVSLVAQLLGRPYTLWGELSQVIMWSSSAFQQQISSASRHL